MSYLVDTNVLLRFIHRAAAEHQVVTHAVAALRGRGERLCITAQNIVELWGVMTRPAAVNGIGLAPHTVEQAISGLLVNFDLLEDDPTILIRWRYLVSTHQVIGRQVHDARLVAVMLTDGVDRLLTFNGSDFVRYPRIQVVHPGQV